MKAEYDTLKHSEGEIRLFPETVDDLWHINHLIRTGDLIFADTFRSMDSQTDKTRPEKAEKKPVRLGIRVEKTEFHPDTARLRISGVIEHGPDTGFYHTINLETAREISVIKRWTSVELERIERAVTVSATGIAHIIAIEEGEAQIYRIRQYGPEHVLTITSGGGKREGVDTKHYFFEEIYHSLSAVTGSVVVAGPGFVKDDFLLYVRRTDSDMADRMLAAETRRTGRGAVQEVIGQGILERITQDLQLGREVTLIEELLRRMGGSGPAAYGYDEVAAAVQYGAVSDILVIDTIVCEENINSLLESADTMRAKITVFSSEFEPGKQLAAIGGIAAILRFPIQ
ncbi:mRNA surveillance protein pelota [Methanogenium organophilum]|uniref:Protein pelota homolog n=1 Tax=Methanogenium organophilum TaxID=2199 RepID=A0A9X9T765_METOG|nr:mRNA surveillance protein pelota [Methanogenium organophilum]WAI01028.1 mRNA surveillance protein pelota [Methanogenium organophilum]